jgi:hypothetical protein
LLKTLFRHIRNCVMLTLLMLAAMTAAQAQQSEAKLTLDDVSVKVVDLEAAYSPGSILSSTTAEKALSEVIELESDLQLWFSDAEQACYDKFFVNACLNTIKLKLREKMGILLRIKVEAKAFQRRRRIEQLDEKPSKSHLK